MASRDPPRCWSGYGGTTEKKPLLPAFGYLLSLLLLPIPSSPPHSAFPYLHFCRGSALTSCWVHRSIDRYSLLITASEARRIELFIQIAFCNLSLLSRTNRHLYTVQPFDPLATSILIPLRNTTSHLHLDPILCLQRLIYSCSSIETIPSAKTESIESTTPTCNKWSQFIK